MSPAFSAEKLAYGKGLFRCCYFPSSYGKANHVMFTAWYRNHCKDVRAFLEWRNSKGHGGYKVYNLTAERPPYQAEKLGGDLAYYPFEDHQVLDHSSILA